MTVQARSADPARPGADVPLVQALDETVARIEALGKQVVLVQDVPTFGFDPYARTLAEVMPPRQLASWMVGGASGSEAGVDRHGIIADPSRAMIAGIAHGRSGRGLVDPVASLCDAGHCRYGQAGALFYFDFQHLTKTGAQAAIRSWAMLTPENRAVALRDAD